MVGANVAPGPRLALVVSSWYPAPDDPVIGRFVADQVAAVVADGQFMPAVITFDDARLAVGSPCGSASSPRCGP